MELLTLLLLVYTAAIVLFFAWAAMAGLKFLDTLPEQLPPVRQPVVSVIVPARNEERNIWQCARGLVAQDYLNLELIFVDDDSEDQTASILAQVAAEDQRAQIIVPGQKPEGWNGKQWACHRGYLNATGDWLCFMDADTFAEPGLISQAIAFAERQEIDLLTLQPWYQMAGLWERVVLPAILLPLLLMFPPHLMNRQKSKTVIGNGQFMLIRREAYESAGRHAGVRNRMMDDIPLARNIHSAGYRVFVGNGPKLLRVRLYTGLREIRAGCLKASVEITNGWAASMMLVVLNMAVNVVPAILLTWAAVAGLFYPALLMGTVVLIQTVYYGVVRVVAFRIPPWSAITYPLGSLIAGLILIEGMIRLAFGFEIRWKGRPVLGRPSLTHRR
nr:glycosyltransferase [Anaerolineae bacterium]